MEIVIKKRRPFHRFSDVTYNEIAGQIASVTQPEQRKARVNFLEKGGNSYGAILKDILKECTGLVPKNVLYPTKKSVTFVFPATKEGRKQADEAVAFFQKVKGDEINETSYRTIEPPYSVKTSNGLEFDLTDAQMLQVTQNEDGTVSTSFNYTANSRNENNAILKAQAEAEAGNRSTYIIIAIIAVAVIAFIATLLIVKKRK